MYSGRDIDYLTSLRSVFSDLTGFLKSLGVKWKSKQDGRKSVRLTIRSWKRLKSLGEGHWLHSSCHCHSSRQSLVSVTVAAPFQERGGGGERRVWELSPRLPQWMFCSSRMAIDRGRMALDQILATNDHHHHHHRHGNDNHALD